MSKHSPAPWKRSRLDPRCIGFTDDRIEPGFQSNFHAVAQVRERTGETEGNMALIETAPELLEVVRDVESIMLSERGHGFEIAIRSLQSRIEAVIVKVVGRV